MIRSEPQKENTSGKNGNEASALPHLRQEQSAQGGPVTAPHRFKALEAWVSLPGQPPQAALQSLP